MQGKITLITPPDIYENSNASILLMQLTDAEQDTVSKWLATSEVAHDLNIYFYNGEPNIPWFLYALNCSEHKYINLDNLNYITKSLSGYIVSKPQVSYAVTDENTAAIYSHINQHRMNNVEQFLETILGG